MGKSHASSEDGGLGIRGAVEVAFLASSHSSSELVRAILASTPSSQSFTDPFVNEAQSRWSEGHDLQTPEGAALCKQAAGGSRGVPVFSQCPPKSWAPG